MKKVSHFFKFPAQRSEDTISLIEQSESDESKVTTIIPFADAPVESSAAVLTSPTSYNYKLAAYKGLTLAAVLLNPLFAVFLYMAISTAIDDSSQELSLDNTFWKIFFITLNLAVSSMSGLSDIIVVNPIEEAKTMSLSTGDNVATERLARTTPVERKSITVFTFFNQAIANTVFLVGSASAALSVAYMTNQTGLRWGLSIPITALELIYLNILSKVKIDEHSHEFLHRLLNPNESMLIKAAKSPAKSLEVTIQVLINALNRGVVYGYIMEQILKEFFGLSNDRTTTGLIAYTAAASFYTSLTSRTLNVHKQFFNAQFNQVSEVLLKSTKVSYAGMGIDSVMTLLRSGAASLLIYRHGTENLPFNITLTAMVGLFLTSHGFYVRYKNRHYQTALDMKLEQLARSNLRSAQPVVGELSSEQLFDLIKEQFKVNFGIKLAATVINAGSRLANWFSFLGFLITMNKLMVSNGYLNLDFYDLLCIQQLLCNPSLENEISFFQENMVDILAYYRTKWHVERKAPHFSWGSFWKTKSDYPKEYLTKLLPRNSEAEIELTQFSSLNVT